MLAIASAPIARSGAAAPLVASLGRRSECALRTPRPTVALSVRYRHFRESCSCLLTRWSGLVGEGDGAAAGALPIQELAQEAGPAPRVIDVGEEAESVGGVLATGTVAGDASLPPR
jgi:hypothetical protein